MLRFGELLQHISFTHCVFRCSTTSEAAKVIAMMNELYNANTLASLVDTIPPPYQAALRVYLQERYNAVHILHFLSADSGACPTSLPQSATKTAEYCRALQSLTTNRPEWIRLVVNVAVEIAHAHQGIIRKSGNCSCYRLDDVPNQVQSDFNTLIDSCDAYTLKVRAIAQSDISALKRRNDQ